MFDPSLFWSAFQAAGMLVTATYEPTSGPPVDFQAGFKRPDQVELDGILHTTQYSIEYQTADVTLKRGAVLTIAGEAGKFRLREPAQAKGDGFFSVAFLERIGA
jgi:hypothetical protein